MNRGTTADLTPIGELPVEDPRLTVDGANITPLAGHPALASLDLGSIGQVDLTPLRTIPNLHGLDLSRADARDLTDLASCPACPAFVTWRSPAGSGPTSARPDRPRPPSPTSSPGRPASASTPNRSAK
ncbi:hypothetical protein [Actinoallomurus sp. CA-142502]|uniref:hypothetical protein n=1 Tax=Actinoallomurus sp. CA-142502 TaxID=3239885 RepID=UPI003D8ECFE6